MPQSKESIKDAARLRKQNQRKRDKEDVTPLDMSHNVTQMANSDVTQLFRYIDGKKVLLDKLPLGYKVLSDGQVWKPTLVIKPVVINDPIRREKARRYQLWKKGKPINDMDPGTAGQLLLICQSLNKHDVAHEVRYGVSGPTMDIVSETLGAS